MTLRALVLGAVFGFLVALTPSCSGTAECDGCLDEDGACVKLRDTNEARCEVGGAACAPCGAGQSCIAGVCTTAATDGGNTCLEPCPGGCCDANGECQECKAVGAACAQDSECKVQLGAAAVCKKSTTSGNAAYPEGYCTILCNAEGVVCPGSSICVGVSAYGEADAFCWAACNPASTTDCRSGYACYEIGMEGGQSANGCWLESVPNPNASAGFAGSACQADGGCAQPPYDSVCVQDTLSDGGVAFPGGLCTAECTGFPDMCGTDGVCVRGYFTVGNPPVALSTCFRSCVNVPGVDPDIPDGGCRESYACIPFLQSDGGVAPEGFCAPSCEIDGCGPTRVCSTAGETQGLCLLPDGGF